MAFVDDCLNSLDLLSALEKLKEDLNNFMASRGFPIKGFAHPKQATLIVYFDAGHEGEMFLFHLQYETDNPGEYHTEFLFPSHCLVPMGRNVPHSELDSTYRASRQANIILDWLQQFIVRKVLLGDA